MLCLLSCQAAEALSPDVAIGDLRRTTWEARDGAPSAVVALAQTSDGYLWLANSSGLTRFDGLRFERIDLPRNESVSSANVMTLLAPSSGGLWIGFTFGGVALLKDGKLTVYSERNGLPPGSVTAMALDHDGALWAATTSGLAKLEGSRWHKVGADQRHFEVSHLSLFVDSAGTLWTSSEAETLFLPRGDKVFQEAFEHSSSRSFGIAESPSGEVWVSDGDRLRKVAQNDIPRRRSAGSGLELIVDRDGSLWFRRPESGVLRIARLDGLENLSWSQAKGTAALYSEYGMGSSGSPVILEDREGNVWAASSTGLTRFSERNVTRHLKSGQSDFDAYSSAVAAGDQGELWVASRHLPPLELREGKASRRSDLGLASCAMRADDGSLWFGGRKGLWKYASGRVERIALPENTDEFEVQAIAQDRMGDLWISVVRRGVFRLAGGVWTAYGGIDSLPRLTAVTLSTDATGRVWFGYTEGRVAVLEEGKVRVFSERSGLPVGNVTAVYGKRTRVWVGGEFGLAVLDGPSFRAVIPDTGITFNSITGIVETAAGDLWLTSSAGIVHYSAAEIRRVTEDASYRPHAEILDSLHGVEGSFARLRPLPTAVEGTDGRLWFLTDAGLYAIDPAHINRNPLPPPVAISSLNVGDESYEPAAGVTLPEGTTSLRIGYVGLSLTMAEKVRYRYQLEGVDNHWQDAKGRRDAFYTNLGPGPHRFRVIAANNDGVWNETGATLDFIIPPTFVQTGWFIALCAAGSVLLVWLLVWFRVRQVASRMRGRFAERMAERERIARELHDTLLQSTQGLVLRFQAVANRISHEDPTRDMLEEALARADAVMAEGRDRVLDLRVAEQPSGDLADALAATGQELAQGRPVIFHSIVEGSSRRLQPVVKDEAFRIGREALLNAFRHSQAESIEVQIVYATDCLRVRVRDDGTGVDARSLDIRSHPDHWGVQGMRERAKRIGAQFDLWSRPESGTEIELTVPAAVAYSGRARRSSPFMRWQRRSEAPPPAPS